MQSANLEFRLVLAAARSGPRFIDLSGFPPDVRLSRLLLCQPSYLVAITSTTSLTISFYPQHIIRCKL